MFYEPAAGHPLPRDPFKAIVAPRPIGWISAVDAEGRVNLAPYSFFNAISTDPHMVMFSSEGEKDALAFARETGEFVCSLATFDLREAMNATSAPLPRGESEFAHAGLTTAPSRIVKAPRVAESPVALECKLVQIVPLTGLSGRTTYHMAIGEVVGVHIDERFLVDGFLDIAAMRPIARAGYFDYFVATPETKFSIRRPPGG
ncbi:flavin reductase family protein [Salinarimonas sp.]|uniref:flavin reductase family protein n=1 Tax=Salinarimonas sp. TaxID=2766526 RepID=UPI00391C945D